MRQGPKQLLKTILCLGIFCTIVFHNIPVSAGVMDSSFKFSTIETEHFYLHYHQGLDKIASLASLISEEAHRELTSVFKWKPLEKTHIVLIDSSDFINAFATVLPQNMIYIQVVPPSEETPIGEYDDWLKMVIIHEYSHMLAMDPVRGYSKVMRDIFGRPIPGSDLLSVLMFFFTSSPNIFLPSWWHEGIATWSETEHTKGGRGRSALYDMIFRMAVEEGNIPSIDQINGNIPNWPAGRMPYIFGLRLHKYIIDQYGVEAVGKMNIAHAGRAPYFLNGVPKRFFQRKHYVRLYKEMIKALTEEQNKRIETLRSLPFTEIESFVLEGELLTNPKYSPDGTKMAYNKQDPHAHKAIMLINSDGSGEREVVRRLPSDQGIAWSPDSSGIYFSQAEFNKGFNVFQDLYYYDLKKEKLKRLTQGLRLGNPDISPDGKKVAAIVSHRGSQNVVILGLNKDNKISDPESSALDVITDHELVRVSNPRWSPDGGSLVYTVKENNGTSGLSHYDLSKREEKSLFQTDHDIAYPAWSGNGDYILYTSDKTGVYNLFAYSMKTGGRFQVTHVLGGVFQPHLSPRGDKIAFSSYNSKGSEIVVTDFRPENFMAEAGPVITPYWDEKNGNDKTSAVALQTLQEEEIVKSDTDDRNESNASQSKPYSALKTLKPRFWLPTMFGDHDGVVTGAMTAGQDVLGYNTYLLEVDYGASSKESYYNAAYVNNYAYPTFILQPYSRPLLYSNFFNKGDFYEKEQSVSLSISVPLNYIESRYSLSLGYEIQKKEVLSDLTMNQFHGIDIFQGDRNNLFVKFGFSNSLKYPYSISHEEGRSVYFLGRYFSKELGSDLSSKEMIASYSEYFRLSSRQKRHDVIYLNMKGGVSDGERISQQSFQLGGSTMFDEFPVRGYPSKFALGKYIATATLEYRTPVWYILRGWNTKPFFWDRLHGAVFTDVGMVWGDGNDFSSKRLKVGAGVEVRMDMTLGYVLKLTPAIGFAHGFDTGGESQVYFTINVDL